MPDHLHGLFGFARDTGIQQTVTAWKHYNSRTLGISWQRDFFEHRLRHDESFDEKALYIRMNPVRKGLCERPEDWPFCWHMTALR
jgi:REP element-mobilizing transposase RayT